MCANEHIYSPSSFWQHRHWCCSFSGTTLWHKLNFQVLAHKKPWVFVYLFFFEQNAIFFHRIVQDATLASKTARWKHISLSKMGVASLAMVKESITFRWQVTCVAFTRSFWYLGPRPVLPHFAAYSVYGNNTALTMLIKNISSVFVSRLLVRKQTISSKESSSSENYSPWVLKIFQITRTEENKTSTDETLTAVSWLLNSTKSLMLEYNDRNVHAHFIEFRWQVT